MKKICFLSAMLIAMNGLVSAQTSYNFNAGTGIWIVNSNPKSYDGQTIAKPEVAPTLFVGASVNKVFESKLVASIGADLHFMLNNGAFKTSLDSDWDSYDVDGTVTRYWWDNYEDSFIGDEENASHHFLIALPIRIGYQIDQFTPNVGFEYGYSINTNCVDNYSTMNVTAGLEYRLSPKLAFTLNYASNLASEMSHTIHKVKESCIETEDGWIRKLEPQAEKKVKWHSQRVEVGISYRLGKTEE